MKKLLLLFLILIGFSAKSGPLESAALRLTEAIEAVGNLEAIEVAEDATASHAATNQKEALRKILSMAVSLATTPENRSEKNVKSLSEEWITFIALDKHLSSTRSNRLENKYHDIYIKTTLLIEELQQTEPSVDYSSRRPATQTPAYHPVIVCPPSKFACGAGSDVSTAPPTESQCGAGSGSGIGESASKVEEEDLFVDFERYFKNTFPDVQLWDERPESLKGENNFTLFRCEYAKLNPPKYYLALCRYIAPLIDSGFKGFVGAFLTENAAILADPLLADKLKKARKADIHFIFFSKELNLAQKTVRREAKGFSIVKVKNDACTIAHASRALTKALQKLFPHRSKPTTKRVDRFTTAGGETREGHSRHDWRPFYRTDVSFLTHLGTHFISLNKVPDDILKHTYFKRHIRNLSPDNEYLLSNYLKSYLRNESTIRKHEKNEVDASTLEDYSDELLFEIYVILAALDGAFEQTNTLMLSCKPGDTPQLHEKLKFYRFRLLVLKKELQSFDDQLSLLEKLVKKRLLSSSERMHGSSTSTLNASNYFPSGDDLKLLYTYLTENKIDCDQIDIIDGIYIPRIYYANRVGILRSYKSYSLQYINTITISILSVEEHVDLAQSLQNLADNAKLFHSNSLFIENLLKILIVCKSLDPMIRQIDTLISRVKIMDNNATPLLILDNLKKYYESCQGFPIDSPDLRKIIEKAEATIQSLRADNLASSDRRFSSTPHETTPAGGAGFAIEDSESDDDSSDYDSSEDGDESESFRASITASLDTSKPLSPPSVVEEEDDDDDDA